MDFQKIEKKILTFWAKHRIFEKSIQNRAAARDFIFYEGPPTANGVPGIHHVEVRAFKDVICRYKTMRGFLVLRKAGWDTHGLPVELEVEKELGFKNKKDIERFGIAKFNALCKKSVWKYKAEWEDLTRKIGFWLDMDHPYITYETPYMESVWAILKKLWDKKLLYKGFKVVPLCPRCGTALSSHEVALGYEKIKEPSIYIKFRIKSATSYQLPATSYLLVWTTTPWTLPANVAVAVHPDLTYAAVEQGSEVLILAKDRLGALEGEYKIIKEYKGKDLLGLEYEPLFTFIKPEKKAHYVIGEGFVSVEEGTGLVHIAPAFGEEDMTAGKENNLPVVMTVNEDGTFKDAVSAWAGVFVKDADPEITADLDARSLLYKREDYEHDYPFCWRCESPLLYYAKESWFIRVSSLKQKLLENNKKVNWVPAYLKEGRFGEWLREVKDWALSRERYWGTPLPLWICDRCGREECVGGVGDLLGKTYSTNTYFFLRHAEAQSNVKRIISSLPEKQKLHLTKNGIRQAKAVAKKLKRVGIDMIFSSPLTRAKETTQIVGKELGIKFETVREIREIDSGFLNGGSLDDYQKFFKNNETSKFVKRPTGGENSEDVRKRMAGWLRKIDKKMHGKNVLLVSHGDPLWLLEGALKGMNREELLIFKKKAYIEKGELRKVKYTHIPYNDDGEIDLHRPGIDAVAFLCMKCNGVMRRIPDLIDVWFDSGAMPFAQANSPFARAQNKKFETPDLFPADFICEAMDQTRGWFYTLLAISTALGFPAPYKNAVSLGWVLDKYGKKMSKSKGNVVDPWKMVEKYGADAVRWYFYTVNQPGDPKLFDEKDIEERLRRFIMTHWNTYLFFETYCSKKRNPKSEIRNPKALPILDRWILSKLNCLINSITKNLDAYDVVSAARALETFVDDLSNWYVRRSRRRFQKPQSIREKQNAEAVLGIVLAELTKLASPFTPFLAEAVFSSLKEFPQFSRNIVRGQHQSSVHLLDWPKPTKRFVNKKLEEKMDITRRMVGLGLKARASAGIKVRQPLSVISLNHRLPQEFTDLIKEELNVKKVAFAKTIRKKSGVVMVRDGGVRIALDTEITPSLREEGNIREITRIIQDMRRDAGYKPSYKIKLFYEGEGGNKDVMQRWQKHILLEAGAQTVIARRVPAEEFDVEREVELEGRKMWLAVKKTRNI